MWQKMYGFLTLRTFAVTRQRRFFFIGAILLVFLPSVLHAQIALLQTNFPLVVQIIEVLVLTLVVYIFASGIRILLVSRYRKKNGLDSEKNDNFTIGANVLVNTVTTFSTVIWVFSVFEIGFVTFLTSIALFSVALATIFKDTIQDFIEGLTILFSANHKIGDYIQVGNYAKGMVMDVTLSKTKLRLEDGSVLYLSNHTVNSSAVTNLSDTPFSRIKVLTLLPHRSSVATLQQDALDAMQQTLGDKIRTEKCLFTVHEVTKDGIEYACEIAVSDYTFSTERKVRGVIKQYQASQTKPKKTKK